MGKSSICRGLIRSFVSLDIDVPSPTYLLCLNYNNEKGQLFHIDPYRLKSVDKIKAVVDWDTICSQHVVLIEWADMVDRTDIDFSQNDVLNIKINGVGLQLKNRDVEM